jgi:hypothetical protein
MFSAGMYVAFAAPFLIMIAPLPYYVPVIRQGFRESLLGVMFGSVSAFMMFGYLPAFMYALEFGFLGPFLVMLPARSKKVSILSLSP